MNDLTKTILEGHRSFVLNQWYVACWDSELDRTPLARTLCGEPVVLYRRLNRDPVALRDACPHRLLPLSLGFKEGDSIRCRYHGLLVNHEGLATEMPVRSERTHKSICTQSYPVIERHRFIWIWLGEKSKADEKLIPDFWPCSHPAWTFDGGYYPIKCDYRLVIDNLMDLTHETYVHQGSIGQPEILDAPIETTAEGDRVTVTRWMPSIDAPPFWRNALKKDGPVDRWQICQFLAPSSVIIDVGVAPVGAGATIEHHDQGVRGFVIDALTPETAHSSHYFWGMARNFDIADLGFTARFKKQQGGVFMEDVAVLEAQQRSILANPHLSLKAFSIDSGGVRARHVIDRMLRAQAQSPEG
ncbi:MAG TPA: aromatic ring-hydroxylating dioxygenase subunit alpha [Steroidobacteraceae bacterium]|jgi:vanillate O-demethylase monooxygenase subunit